MLGACVEGGMCGRVCMVGACIMEDMHGRGACMAGGMHVAEAEGACMAGSMHGRGHVWQGACMAGGMHGRGTCMAGEMATAADSKHPTGMHSC